MVTRLLLPMSVLFCVLLTVSPLAAQYTFVAGNPSGAVGAPGDLLEFPIFLDTATGDDVQSWQFGVCTDDLELIVDDAIAGLTTATVNAGSEADFVAINFDITGVTMGTVVNFLDLEVLTPGDGNEVLLVTYLLEGADGTVADVEICDTLLSAGMVLVPIEVAVASVGITAAGTNGTIDIVAPQFVRGDTNDDGTVNIVDVVFFVSNLFSVGQSSCTSSFDVDDGGSIGILDAVLLLQYLFAAGAEPAAPFPDCGADPVGDELLCGPTGCP